ncbi:hypothetical protein [Colwellia echini]|uniref:Uncharacterized protein n=1 Tax=Colwellia echini TaxID=1982103 RepID=A0ABY3MY16_9GAMM|nr:hypothetical protein [Colwellia echini]TYK66103.1 hypothetical protein CWS31_007500 [Colwellia echini]
MLTLISHLRLYSAVKAQLSLQLPATLNSALVNSFNNEDQLNKIADKIVLSNQRISVDNPLPLPLVNFISLEHLKFSLSSTGPKNSNEGSTAASVEHNEINHIDGFNQLSWQNGSELVQAEFLLTYQFNMFNTIIISLLLSSLLSYLFYLLPNKQRQEAKQWQDNIEQAGVNKTLAVKLAKLIISQEAAANSNDNNLHDSSININALPRIVTLCIERGLLTDEIALALIKAEPLPIAHEQQLWFIKALEHQHTVESALIIAKSDEQLSFNLSAKTITAHGLTITLTATPLFYYYWYAQRAISQLPLYVNPSQTQPDRKQGELLATIMLEYNGHSKAMNDLSQNGLKAKALELNRNKIKDELMALLGDLASPYLLIKERDLKTTRYKYGFSTDLKILL